MSRTLGDHGDRQRALGAGLAAGLPGAGLAAPGDTQGGEQDGGRLPRHGSSISRTWTVWGPCTPITSVSSMSEVRDGPVMNVITWLATPPPGCRTRARASPSESQMQRADSSATWIGGTSDTTPPSPRADSTTILPVP